MVKYDQGYLDGLLSLMQKRRLTSREQGALDKALHAAKQRKRREREIERQQVREQNGG